jgi:hypothetical protein
VDVERFIAQDEDGDQGGGPAEPFVDDEEEKNPDDEKMDDM